MLQLTLSPQGRAQALLEQWRLDRVCERLWQKDLGLWPGQPRAELADRLGWLDLPATFETRVAKLAAKLPRPTGRIVLLGMGGSSMAPEVWARCYGNERLLLLDSTHPVAVQAIAKDIRDDDFFVVASKSGTTGEIKAFFAFFWRLAQARWPRPAERFLAISDANTPLTRQAHKLGITCCAAPGDVGGRFSALSEFGLAPALLTGLQPLAWYAALADVVARCRLPAPANPAAQLAACLVAAATSGQDKILLQSDGDLAPVFVWIEQLLAESLGKDGQGLLPLAAEWQTAALCQRADVAVVRLTTASEPRQAACTLRLAGADDLAALFFVWEFAVALVGAALGLQPFDQPNVEAAKQKTRELLGGDATTAAASPLLGQVGVDAQGLRAYIASSDKPLALLAFAPPQLCERDLPRLAKAIATASGRPICIGVGPRFLHASGQLFKGSPQKVAVLQIVQASGPALAIPGESFNFGDLLQAQADGDLLALQAAGADVRRWAGDWNELLSLFA